jgi:hypothetical protein
MPSQCRLTATMSGTPTLRRATAAPCQRAAGTLWWRSGLCVLLVTCCIDVVPAAESWTPEEFTVVSGPASPRVALAVRRDGPRLAVAVEAAVLPGGEPSVKLGIAAAKQVVLDATPETGAGEVRRFTATIPATALVGSDADWKRLRIGLATVWSGGPGEQPRLSERFRHVSGAAHRGLASDASAWQPFDLDENATAVADRKNRIIIPLEQPLDGKATVVIETPDGTRLRNLIGGLELAKGRRQITWDGCDDQGQPLPPGSYRWRAAHHPGLVPRYLMSFGNGDNTPADFGGWGPNHTIITAATASGPWTVMCSPMTEGGDNIVVLAADGTKAQGHVSPHGTGMWTICPAIIGDTLYCTNDGMAWGDHFDATKKDAVGRLKIGLTRFDLKSARLVEYQGKRFKDLYSVEVGPGAADKDWQQVSLAGMAAFGGRLYVANRRTNALMVINPEDGAQQGEIPLAKPGPLAASADALYAISDGALVRVDVTTRKTMPVIAKGAFDARGLAIDAQGRFLVTDGTTHTLRVFDRNGKPVKQVGKPGGRYVGPYDRHRLVDPRGVAVASNGWVWIAEDRAGPKRVSAWDLTKDAVVCEKFGTPAYGGSGAGMDPQDHSRWLGLGCEWKVDLASGTATPTHVLGKEDHPLHYRYVYQFGHTWVVAIQGTTGIYRRERDGSLKHVAEIGQGHRLYHYHERKPPKGYVDGFNRAYPDRPGKEEQKGPGFLWLDRNGDGTMQGEEFEFSVGMREFGGGYWGHDVAQDLTVRIPVEIDGKRRLLSLIPTGVKDGLPQYPSIAEAAKSAVPVDLASTQVETWPDLKGTLIVNTEPVMRAYGPDGRVRWSHPNRWANVHGSHKAPLPETGVLQGVLFSMGMAPLDQEGDVFVLVGNHGRFFTMTSDGLYLDEFFKDVRMGGSRDANYIGGEAFGGNFAKSAKDGKYYLQANSYRIYRIDGLDRVTRSSGRIDLTQAQAIAAERVRAQRQAAAAAPKVAGIPFLATAPTIDGKDDDWKGQPVLEWDRSGQFRVTVGLGHDGTNLYACWRVQDQSPWVNTGKDWTLLFKTGDSVDLQIGTDPNANPKRSGPVPGDLRLLIAPSDGQNLAVLYRHRVPGAKDPVTFTCPWRAETVDEVKRLTAAKIAVTTERDRYRVELAVPLAELGLGTDGAPRRFDVGTLFGDPQGTATSLRSYWSNQNTGLVSDVPGEIMLFPNLWGTVTMGGKP